MGTTFVYEPRRYAFSQGNDISEHDLEEHFRGDFAYMYFILARNRITINHTYLKQNGGDIELEFFINDQGCLISEKVKIKRNNPEPLYLDSKYPHHTFHASNSDGEIKIGAKASYLLNEFEYYSQIQRKDLLDYEIVYIGESAVKILVSLPLYEHSPIRLFSRFYPITIIIIQIKNCPYCFFRLS